MYTPKPHLITYRAEILAFLKKYHFGVLVTTANNEITATHLPFVVEEEEENMVIYGHCAKANPQWGKVEANNVLVIFSEPMPINGPAIMKIA
jgi:transcriptional regulator